MMHLIRMIMIHMFLSLQYLSLSINIYTILIPPSIPTPLAPPIQNPLHHLPNRQTARQPGTLNPQEIHKPLEPLIALLADDKIQEALSPDYRSGVAQFRPDPAVVDRDPVALDAGEVVFYLVESGGEAGGRGRVVGGGIDPFDVRAEADLRWGGEVEG